MPYPYFTPARQVRPNLSFAAPDIREAMARQQEMKIRQAQAAQNGRGRVIRRPETPQAGADLTSPIRDKIMNKGFDHLKTGLMNAWGEAQPVAQESMLIGEEVLGPQAAVEAAGAEMGAGVVPAVSNYAPGAVAEAPLIGGAGAPGLDALALESAAAEGLIAPVAEGGLIGGAGAATAPAAAAPVAAPAAAAAGGGAAAGGAAAGAGAAQAGLLAGMGPVGWAALAGLAAGSLFGWFD